MSSAAVFLGEPISPLRWGAAALLVGGVALTSLAPAKKVRSADAPAPEPINEPV
jgi:O-acetylserine/cysteine efflux transporter